MRKCAHGVYWPDADPVALSCQLCNPGGTGDGPVPILPRSSADPLNAVKTEKIETCECGNVRTYFSDICRFCHKPFPKDLERGRVQGTANAHAAGTCPECGSTIHYETKKKNEWECADCGELYPASKKVGKSEN